MTLPDPTEKERMAAEVWKTYMTTGQMPKFLHAPWFEARWLRPIVKVLPSEPRCRICYYPFGGLGGRLARGLFGVAPSPLNPQLCNLCERAAHYFPGGAEVEMTLLFADVRGSTGIAERLSTVAFGRLIERFYRTTSKVLFRHNALIEKLIGDEVTGFFVPGIAGADHARVAIEAARGILRATGHADAGGPWIPIGIGVHTGIAYVGAVGGTESVPEIAVLGDAVNIAARIASQAAAGEVLFSETSREAAGVSSEGLEGRRLALKGRSEPLDVWASRPSGKQPA